MRARLIITLALFWCFGPGRADADDFDDDFGQLPAARAPSAANESAQPTAKPTTEAAPEAAANAYPPLDGDPELAPAPATEARRKLRTFVHPSVDGLVGGVHTIDASSAWPGTFRVGLFGGLFRKNGFTARNDHHRSNSTELVLNVTPIEHLELAAVLATRSTENRTMDPHVVQVVGDAHLFAKTFWSVLPWLTVGGDMELALLNGVGSIGPLGGATSVGLRGSATLDLRALERDPLPILVRSNLRYLFDNSNRLGRDIERDRYDSLASQGARSDEFRQFLSPAERSALGINRVDRIGLSVGVEVPLQPHERVRVSPLLEWGFALPVNRQGFDCLEVHIAGQRDGCLAKTGFGARPSTLTLGTRVQPWLDGLAVLLAIDVATSGSHTFVRELAPLERYVVRLGISYAYDPRKPVAPRARIQRVEIPSAPWRGHVLGEVVDSQTSTPIAGAIVHFEATDLSDVLSDARGTFRSAELPAGAVGMRVRAEGYLDSLCIATLNSNAADVGARCELTPSAYYGALDGHVVDSTGKPVGGVHLALSGARELSLTSKKDGSFHGDKLPEGAYTLSATAPGYFAREVPVVVTRGAEARPSLMLLARPAQSLVKLTPRRIVLGKPIQFSGESAVISEASQSLLGEVAELLSTHPQLANIEVAGHLDDAPGEAAALALSEQRAEAVRAWLVRAGIASERLTAKGYGSTRPVVPNITMKNRARNRRIELLIK
ncbi:MAG: OmpA/MotB domain protein [Myxococcaceae bacterium]|nr:OmpA/MotB domain protein [Myxococcaceae bacterium]